MLLRFTLPTRTTDDQPLRADHLTAVLCRQAAPNAACSPVDAASPHTFLTADTPTPELWTDTLPTALRSGGPRALVYKLELRNPAGRTAGYGDPAYAAGGSAPPPVTNLRAIGVRQGIQLRWAAQTNAGEVLLERQAPPGATSRQAGRQAGAATTSRPHARSATGATARHPSAEAGTSWLQADPGDRSAAATLDASAQAGVLYTYTAVRRVQVQLGARTLELRSAASAPVTFTWEDVYPPAAPTDLTALGYTPPAPDDAAAPPAYAVDLIWQPVLDDRLAGYLVYREPLDVAGQPQGARTRLTAQPISTPGYHDATAQPGQRYRYSVTAIDPTGNESPAAVAEVSGTGA